MRTLVDILAPLAILANAIVYGTDVSHPAPQSMTSPSPRYSAKSTGWPGIGVTGCGASRGRS